MVGTVIEFDTKELTAHFRNAIGAARLAGMEKDLNLKGNEFQVPTISSTSPSDSNSE